jgi:predicted MPP superfamily phosphohydrolase
MDRQDLPAAIGPTRRADSVILLSHNPDYAERIRDDRVGHSSPPVRINCPAEVALLTLVRLDGRLPSAAGGQGSV